MKKIAWLLVAATFAGCPSAIKPPVTPPVGEQPCISAEKRLLELGCTERGRPLGGPTKKGIAFSALCQRLIAQDIMGEQEATCIAMLPSCDVLNTSCGWGGE